MRGLPKVNFDKKTCFLQKKRKYYKKANGASEIERAGPGDSATQVTNTAYHLPYSAGNLSQGSSTFQQFQLFQHWLNTSATVSPATSLTPTQGGSIPSQPVQLKRLRDEAEETTGEKGRFDSWCSNDGRVQGKA